MLVIEDDAETAGMLTDFFELEGFQTVAADSAFGAMDLVRRTRPDAVVMDVVFPYRSGLSFLSRLTTDPDTAGIPVIVCTAFPETLSPARAAQAAAVLQKPLDLRHLLMAARGAVRVGQAHQRRRERVAPYPATA